MAETIVDLGKRVKAKYPGQYDDLEDADVGRRVKAKYPGAYDDFTDVDQPIAMSPSQRAEAMASRKSTPEFVTDPTAQFRQAQEAQLQRLPVGLGMLAATGLAGEAAPALIANPAVREVAKKALPPAIGYAVGQSAPSLLRDLIKHFYSGR